MLRDSQNVTELREALGSYEGGRRKEERKRGGEAKSGFGSGTKSESFNGCRVASPQREKSCMAPSTDAPSSRKERGSFHI